MLRDCKNAPFPAAHTPLVREVRSAADLVCVDRGDRTAAAVFAAEIAEVMAAHAFEAQE